jgi:hypothetical protein
MSRHFAPIPTTENRVLVSIAEKALSDHLIMVIRPSAQVRDGCPPEALTGTDVTQCIEASQGEAPDGSLGGLGEAMLAEAMLCGSGIMNLSLI